MSSCSSLTALRELLSTSAPALTSAIFNSLAPKLIVDNGVGSPPHASKDINDPVWRIITLEGAEVDLLDLPLFQRLRRVRQLGLAHQVYPGALHTRFEHSLGAMHAATLVYDRLCDKSETNALLTGYRQAVRLAALLHDCGHTVFSHVGEQALVRLFKSDLEAAQGVLDQFFPDDLDASKPGPANKGISSEIHTAPAELISVLLVLSPAMEEFLRRREAAGHEGKNLLRAAALILGRPHDISDGRTCFHFLKGIVSGDLDADKLDYVARDAYFAGLPVSADVPRLLSQLEALELDGAHLSAEEGAASTVANTRYMLFGVRPAGVSAFEMFVLTRAYLFDRLYSHHKIRAAEQQLDQVLNLYAGLRLKNAKQQEALGVGAGDPVAVVQSELLELLYHPCGDDHVTAVLACQDYGEYQLITTMANTLISRSPLKRALAFGSRFLARSDQEDLLREMDDGVAWSRGLSKLRNYAQRRLLRDLIVEILTLSDTDAFLVDVPKPNPIRENPDVYVRNALSPTLPERINLHFSVEQLSNAYRHTKEVFWVFCEEANRARVAAATCIALLKLFDVRLGLVAVSRAKVDRAAYEDELRLLANHHEASIREAAKQLLVEPDKAPLRLTPDMWRQALEALDEAVRDITALRLYKQFKLAAFPRALAKQTRVVLRVMGILLRHAKMYWDHSDFREEAPKENEKRFQRSVIDFIRAQPESNAFDVREGEVQANGRVDIVIEDKRSLAPAVLPIVVELKSANESFQKLYEAYSGQPMKYAERALARICFLYVQFGPADGVFKPDETITMRVPDRQNCARGDVTTDPLTICLGTSAFSSKTPSKAAIKTKTLSA